MSRRGGSDGGSGAPFPLEGGFRPLRVAIIDLAEEMPTLQRTRPDGSDFGGAWILVLDKGAPLGVVEFTFSSDSMGGAALEALLIEGTKGDNSPGPPDEVPDSELPFASIVVPTTFDRFDQLQECVERLSTLDYPDYEVVVVDNRPDRSRAIRKRDHCAVPSGPRGYRARTGHLGRPQLWHRQLDGRIRRIHRRRREATPKVATTCRQSIRSRARGLLRDRACDSRRIRNCTHLWFEQSGCGLDRNLHPYHYRSLSYRSKSAGVGHAAFMVRRQEQNKNVDHWIYMFGSFGMGRNMSFRRSFFSGYGGFDCALGAGTPSRGGEDILPLVELLYSRQVLAYEPSAIVSHAHRRTYAELQHQIYGYGVGSTAALTALAWRNPRHLIGYLRVFFPGVLAFMGRGPSTRPEKPSDYPAELTRLELKGLLLGPIAYIHARWVYRRN